MGGAKRLGKSSRGPWRSHADRPFDPVMKVFGNKWCARQESNLRPTAPEAVALSS